MTDKQPPKAAAPGSDRLVWREAQSNPLIMEAEPRPGHCYLMVEHGMKWAASAMVGKNGTTLSPRPETHEVAMWRVQSHWEAACGHE